MLPPLTQPITEARVVAEAGPSRDALLRSTTASPPSTRPPGYNSSASPAAARRSTAIASKPTAQPPPYSNASSSTATASPRRFSTFIPSPRVRVNNDTISSQCEPTPLPSNGEVTAIESLSRIPREFFVIETNAVLPQRQFPPTQYQSTFLIGSGTWETVVFPAMAPRTRQQVLLLRQTLEKMRQEASKRSGSSVSCVSTAALAFTEQEWALHSLCFHELARQIKFICKEQSELLFEIQAAYDASQSRLVTLVRQLQQENEQCHNQIETLMDEQHKQTQAMELQRREMAEKHDAAVVAAAAQRACSCNNRKGRSASGQRRRRRTRLKRLGDDPEDSEDDKSDGSDDDSDDEYDDDEEEWEWRAFQRQRRMRLRRLGGEQVNDEEDGDENGREGGGGRQRRSSIAEENMAAARVQQAFSKYQHRKEAHRALQREEKIIAALDIQRSYRGYKQRQFALHKRAVMHTILHRRQQVAAVELLQMNVRAYLIKKRREDRRGRRAGVIEANSAALASMLEAQRVATPASSAGVATTTDRRAVDDGHSSTPVASSDETTAIAEPTNDRITELLGGLSELAASFSFLHSRRRNAKRLKRAMAAAATQQKAVGVVVPTAMAQVAAESASVSQAMDVVDGLSGKQDADSSGADQTVQSDGEKSEKDDEMDDALLSDAIKRAEELMQSFRSVIRDLRRDAASHNDDGDGDGELTKATSTTTLLPESHGGAGEDEASTLKALGAAASFLFTMDDDDDDNRKSTVKQQSHGSKQGGRSPFPSPRGRIAGVKDSRLLAIEDNESDDTHLDDVLWQTSVYTPRSAEQQEDDAAAQQFLLQELRASRDQQKRHALLKQFIVDIYDTIVGRLRDLPSVRLQKLIKIHASLALSFADGQRFLRTSRRSSHSSAVSSSSEYEPVSAFVGRLDVNDLIRDHFHCQVGLKHLIDASMERFVADLHSFMGFDPDVQRFYEFLTHERSLEELVFFCVCRLLARDTGSRLLPLQHQLPSQSSQSIQASRQPVFHGTTMRELIDLPHAMGVATALFHATGQDADMLATDAFIIEPNNEIYTRHLPSSGLQQLEAILQHYVAPVDSITLTAGGGDGGMVEREADSPCAFVRASNVNQFHAKEFNVSAARSPLVRRANNQPPWSSFQPGAGLVPSSSSSSSPSSSSSCAWIYFDEFVDLLRRYRTVMRHFHSFIHWTHELFHDAFRRQKQQQLAVGGVVESPPSSTTATTTNSPLLEEAAFVETLLPFSLGASDRELRNVFHNALKQRHLQRLMPVRVFVSVVLVLLRNGLLSVTSYAPLQKTHELQPPLPLTTTSTPRPTTQTSYGSTYRQKREEKQWMQLALQWRSQEQDFEAAVERIYATASPSTGALENENEAQEQEQELEERGGELLAHRSVGGSASAAEASQLLAWRNELYELFMNRSGCENVERAQRLYALLMAAIHTEKGGFYDTTAGSEQLTPEPQVTDTNTAVPELVADVIGSPWEAHTDDLDD